LINPIGDTKIQKYSAENPEKVISFLENKIKQTEEKLKQAHLLLPELLSVFNVKEKPKVKFYEGIERVKEANILLDFANKTHNGLSFRTFESI
jgi:hypothetical protein